MKGELLEGGLRIPAIVRWPGRVRDEHGFRAGHDLDGLDADAARGRRSGAGSSYPPDGENLLPVLTKGARRIRASCSGVSGPERNAPSATAIGSICGPTATNSCSTSSRIRASAPISRAETRGRVQSPADGVGDLETRQCCPKKPGSRSRYRHPGAALADHYGLTNPK